MRTEDCSAWSEISMGTPGCQLKLPDCQNCPQKIKVEQKDFLAKWQDPLEILDRRRTLTPVLRGMLAGGGAFLLCGGPSANDLPLEQLSRRGIWTMAVNNSAGHPRVRPQAFVCSDPPKKFSYSIWLDPGIMKFLPTPKLRRNRGRLRRKELGAFIDLPQTTAECPNVWAFKRYSWLYPDDRFFTTDGACWGNHQVGVEMTGQPKTVCTMLLGIRLLYYLGTREIYLVGVDFRMTPESGYSFEQSRTAEAAASNNHLFAVTNQWLCEMQKNGTFDRFGLSIFNCFQSSGLRAFPYLPFEQAIERAKGIVEDKPDLSGWYDS